MKFPFTKLQVGIATTQSCDGEGLKVETANEKYINNTTTIVGEDIDLLVILIVRTQILTHTTNLNQL